MTGLGALITVVPDRLVRRDIGPARGGVRVRQLALADRIKAKSDARASLLQSISALGLVVGLVFTLFQVTSTQRIAQRQLQLTEDRQLDDRFGRAVQNLADKDLSIRLGSVYALGEIAEEDRYRLRALAVLAVYARSNAGKVRPNSETVLQRLQPDVYAALEAGCTLGGGPPFSDLLELSGRALAGAKLDHCALPQVDFSGADLAVVDLSYADLSFARMSHADLNSADLTGAKMSSSIPDAVGADLNSADLTSAILIGADLTLADLTGATMSDAVLTGAKMTRAILSRANLGDVDLTDLDLAGADFTGADLSGSDLAGAVMVEANLTGANLNRADLTGADLTGANLAGANLTVADLTSADLTDATANAGTRWPAGFDPAERGVIIN